MLFIVADIISSPPIIGLPTCDKLNLVQRTLVLSTQVSDNDIINEFSDVFAVFGCISGSTTLILTQMQLLLVLRTEYPLH